jgi:Carboxylesterase family
MITRTNGILAAAVFTATLSLSQVPADIAAKLVAMGPNVCPADTAALYRHFQPTPPYPGVKVTRDISYGADPREIMDVFTAEKGGGNRTVLIYVSGGAGNKIEPVPQGDAFYDNIMLWATKNNMVGVNVQRRAGGGEWNDPAKDISTVIQWVHKNIAQYKGNPNRVFIWSHSAGNPPVGTYLGRPELYGPDGIGVKGAILMSPAAFNIAPVVTGGGPGGGGGRGTAGAGGPGAGGPGGRAAGGGGGCPSGPAFGGGARGGAPGPQAKGGPGGPGGGGPGGGGPGGAKGSGGGGRGRGPVDPAVQLERSALPGLKAAKISFFLAYAELDPGMMGSFIHTLADQLNMAGNHPTVVEFKAHSHMSEVFSPGSPDTSVSGPILKWMKSVK